MKKGGRIIIISIYCVLIRVLFVFHFFWKLSHNPIFLPFFLLLLAFYSLLSTFLSSLSFYTACFSPSLPFSFFSFFFFSFFLLFFFFFFSFFSASSPSPSCVQFSDHFSRPRRSFLSRWPSRRSLHFVHWRGHLVPKILKEKNFTQHPAYFLYFLSFESCCQGSTESLLINFDFFQSYMFLFYCQKNSFSEQFLVKRAKIVCHTFR